MLQIRNQLLQHGPIPLDARLDLTTRVAGQRVLQKGVEVDLHTTAWVEREVVWESLNTFYYRGFDAWLKGPVYQGSSVSLRARADAGGTAFAVVAEGEHRPAIVGRWRSVPAGSRLVDGDGGSA